MLCTLFLSTYLTAPFAGQQVVISTDQLAGYTTTQVAWAKKCAQSRGVMWRCVDARLHPVRC